jgi:hypothetical protein
VILYRNLSATELAFAGSGFYIRKMDFNENDAFKSTSVSRFFKFPGIELGIVTSIPIQFSFDTVELMN